MDFKEALRQALCEYNHLSGNDITLKPKQVEALSFICQGFDAVINLPVGYGKSLIYQLFPSTLARLRKLHVTDIIVLVISPLTIIQHDQMKKMQNAGINSCRLDVSGELHWLHDQNKLQLDDIRKGKISFIHCHPEGLFCTERGDAIISDPEIVEKIRGIFIDECHIIDEWSTNFRKAFQQLSDLTTIFPTLPHCALSGTLTVIEKKKLLTILNLEKPVIIEENPHCPNIYLNVIRKEKNSDILCVFENIFKNEVDKLHQNPEDYPVTLLFIPLRYMAAALMYAKSIFKSDIYNVPYSALFSKQDSNVTQYTIKELQKSNPKLRLIFSTSVCGMGFDSPSINTIIHACPPRNVSKYLQEIGRGGRNGMPCSATLYYNASDIAPNLPGIKTDIINYCKEKENCLWDTLLIPFGYKKYPLPQLKCCVNCDKLLSKNIEDIDVNKFECES